MKRSQVALLGVLSLCLFGMGELDSSYPLNEIPTPEKDFSASITDNDGTTTHLSQVSIDGNIYIEGKRGKADIASEFSALKSISFEPGEKGTVKAVLEPANGDPFHISVEEKDYLYGKAKVGSFRIKLKDLKEISFEPVPQSGEKSP